MTDLIQAALRLQINAQTRVGLDTSLVSWFRASAVEASASGHSWLLRLVGRCSNRRVGGVFLCLLVRLPLGSSSSFWLRASALVRCSVVVV